MIYGYSKKTHKIRNFFLIFFLMVAVSAISIFIYSMYTRIEVIDYSSETATATRLYNDAVSEEDDIVSSLEDITRCVVRNI